MKMIKQKNKIATFEKKLKLFLKHNPYSKVQRKKKAYYVLNPWNDKSMAFILRGASQTDLIAALNNLILPTRFTALYHLDSNTMEYIYTLLPKNDSCLSRQFNFIIDGEDYCCKFGGASDRLLILSKFFRRTGEETGTGYRNLLPFRSYIMEKSKPASTEDYFVGIKPISFFVSGFKKFDEDKIINVSKHLNFFMRYYDRESPIIIIHSIASELAESSKELRFLQKEFPRTISTRCHNPFLLDIALAANEANTRLAFLYYYQILEYAAFYYVDTEVKRRMLQIICTPDIHANPDKYLSRLLDTVTEMRQSDEAKLNKIVQIGCSLDVVWKELQQNLPYFSKRQEFEGGFAIEPFISEDTTFESFATMWIPKMPDILRKIRNALVHGRESRLGLAISPTRNNDLKIRPWFAVIRRIAEQVLISSSLA